jgi:hypothetical protein
MANTKQIMIASVLFMVLLGLAASFAPDNILEFLQIPTSPQAVVLVQCLSGLYLGFAMLNWMSRTAIIGGIYARPLVIGNFLHFAVGSLSLLKHADVVQHNLALIILTAGYFLFAVLFGLMMMRHPKTPGAA